MEYFVTRTCHNWNDLPGGIDNLNLMKGMFESDDPYGIPMLKRENFKPEDLVPYHMTLRPKAKDWDNTIHFFLDDYKFESVWNSPNKCLSRIQKIGRALTPDFSLYLDYPVALQIYNVYRNRWLGRYWQENGIAVIPTVSWGDESTYDFCFRGIPKNNAVAISTVGTRNADVKELFIKGFMEMLKQLKPKTLIVYGEHMPLEFDNFVDNVYYYDTHWGKKRKEGKL